MITRELTLTDYGLYLMLKLLLKHEPAIFNIKDGLILSDMELEYTENSGVVSNPELLQIFRNVSLNLNLAFFDSVL